MKALKNPQFIIPIIIIILMLGWIGYQKINAIKIKPEGEQANDTVDEISENNDELLNNETQKTEPDDKSELANPASVYCEKQGYKLEMRTDESGGQYGVCIFDDGSECDEWAYFRSECVKGDSLKIEDEDPVADNGKKDGLTDEAVDTDDWNSFTHRAYNYTIKFPKNWHWDGTDVKVLIISSESIKSKDENLTLNNLKIIKADQEIIEGILEKNPDAEIASLNDNFKAAYLKNHTYPQIIEQIIKSFEI
ncbi:MAG: DUF333 domain-containing protein [Candidatus Jacksonbacteria bacterium]